MIVKFREKKVCGQSKEKDEQIGKKRMGKAFAKSLTKSVENLDKNPSNNLKQIFLYLSFRQCSEIGTLMCDSADLCQIMLLKTRM